MINTNMINTNTNKIFIKLLIISVIHFTMFFFNINSIFQNPIALNQSSKNEKKDEPLIKDLSENTEDIPIIVETVYPDVIYIIAATVTVIVLTYIYVYYFRGNDPDFDKAVQNSIIDENKLYPGFDYALKWSETDTSMLDDKDALFSDFILDVDIQPLTDNPPPNLNPFTCSPASSLYNYIPENAAIDSLFFVTPLEHVEEGDVTLPPLEYVGEDDVTLPPLEYVGEDDVTLPPLEHVGEGDVTLPPLEHVGEGDVIECLIEIISNIPTP